MRVITGEGRRGPVVSSFIVVGAVARLGTTIVSNTRVSVAAPLIGATVALVLGYRRLLTWRALIGLTILIILFIPIRRYALPSALPFQLEPYRLVIAFIAVGWISSLLVDPRVRLRSTTIDTPLMFFLIVILLSLIANPKRVSAVEQDTVKKLMFFASFFIVYYLVASVAHRFRDVDFLARMLVGGGTVVAFFTIIEAKTGYNVFSHLNSVLPFLHQTGAGPALIRGGRLRALASSQHPIALGAALMMIAPLAAYRAHCFRERRYWFAAAILVFGALSTVSRTAVVMLGVIAITLLILRPIQIRRLWPFALPALVALHFALPGTIGSLRGSLFPKGGLVAQQANANVGSGRIATLGPALHNEWKPNPILGEGFATRVTTKDAVVPVPNGPILDDQWLGILLETGVLGTASLLWVFARFIRRTGKEAKADLTDRGWLLCALCSSIAAFAVGMFFYDAFSFIQVTFLFFIMMGMAGGLMSSDSLPRRARVPRRARAAAVLDPPEGLAHT